MNRSDRKYALYVVCLLLLGVVTLWGCPKKADVASTSETQREEAPAIAQAPAEEPAAPAPAENTVPEDREAREQAALAARGLQPVFFDLDLAQIRAEAREVLKANAEWMKAHPQAKIKIEGNCDERGTREYNQALGQRRAVNAKKFMTDMGVSSKRITLISYGKEKPSCMESSEGCWQKNRRDDFTVVAD